MLGALLLAIGFRTVKSAFYYFNPDLAVAFIQLGLSACLLIGPLTYLYVHCHLAEVTNSAVGKHWYLHLVLPLCLIGIAMLFPYSRNTETWFYAICGIHAYWFFYLLLAGGQLWQARAALGRFNGRFSRQTVLLLSVYFSSLLILIAYVSTPFTSYIIGALSFTFSIHITVLTYIMKDEALDEAEKKEKYQNKRMSDDDVHALLNSLDKVMCEQQLYLNPALNLAMLAKKVGKLQTTVSQAINENLNKSFNLYINEFRIQHATSLLITAPHLNMELVAERSGFNSNSTFFSAFKKVTGQTPASYRAVFASVPLSSCGDGANRAPASPQHHRVTSDS